MTFIKKNGTVLAAITLSFLIYTNIVSAKKAANDESVIDMGLMTSDGKIITDKDEEAAYVAAQEHGPKPPTFIPEIIGKTQKAVMEILGQPDSECDRTRHGFKCYYKDGGVEIVYINNKADWITVNDPEGIGFYPGALVEIGLNCPVDRKRVRHTPDVISWEKTCPGILSASLFPGASDNSANRPISYIYIKVATP